MQEASVSFFWDTTLKSAALRAMPAMRDLFVALLALQVIMYGYILHTETTRHKHPSQAPSKLRVPPSEANGCTDTASAQWAEEPSEEESREEVSEEDPEKVQDQPFSGILDEMAQLIFPS
jgi:hypothetical protein